MASNIKPSIATMPTDPPVMPTVRRLSAQGLFKCLSIAENRDPDELTRKEFIQLDNLQTEYGIREEMFEQLLETIHLPLA